MTIKLELTEKRTQRELSEEEWAFLFGDRQLSHYLTP